jgi:TPR repeat protein
MYFYGKGVADLDYELAIQHYKTAADQDYAHAQLQLGFIYDKGYGADQDWKKAVVWYTNAANQNNATAHFNLGKIYFYGDLNGVEVNYRLAFQHYKTAANQGYTIPQEQLVLFYEEGYDKDPDLTIIIEWCTKTENKNSVTANYNLGNMYLNGEGLGMNYQLSLQHYQIAANQGYANAQSQMGFLYENGYGTEKDLVQAIKWYSKAANQKNAAGSYSLGNMYLNGKGVEMNHQRSFQYYEIAAEKGHADAQSQLGSIYKNGYGTEKDLANAIN